MPEKHIAAAIDGPVGAGKSSIAREAAKKLGFIYVDTGALYRAVGLYCHRCGTNMKDPADIASRLPEISMAASAVSAVPEVRAALLGIQRGIAAENNVIMDGRDIGTVVLPNAQVKIFLTAAPEIRAKRRYDELCAKGVQTTFEEVLADLNKRYYDDSHRAAAPLKQADDAVLADTSGLDFEQSCELICSLIKEKL